MQIIPTVATPSQTITITLGDQACVLNVYQKFYGLFVDLYVDGALVIGGVVAEDRNRIVRSTYLGFEGDLAFFDTLGKDDPDFTGLGVQFLLAYLETTDAGLIA